VKKIRRVFDQPPPPPPIEDDAQMELPLEGLRLGDSRQGVAALQLRLGLPVTGTYSEVDAYAVADLQRHLHMTINGVACPKVHGHLGLPWPPFQN
jgi:hypothetical protein